MSRHKSRVTRRGRCNRKGRVGSRKQAGGFLHLLNPFNWFKKTDPIAAPADATDATAAANPATVANPAAVANPATVANPAAAAAKSSWNPFAGGGRKKSRKTRHRRRHHRK